MLEVLLRDVNLDVRVGWGLLIEIVIKVLIENGFARPTSLGMDGRTSSKKLTLSYIAASHRERI